MSAGVQENIADFATARERVTDLVRQTPPGRRVLLGIAGPPGSGKSTLAARLVASVGPDTAVVVAMDGFHLSDSLLRQLGRAERKGAPDTFDAAAYVDLLARLRDRDRDVFAPVFDRGREIAEVGGLLIPAGLPLVVTEGNYLLHDRPPWREVRQLLTQCWYVTVDEELRRGRLRRRHLSHGRSPADANLKTDGPDQVNAQLVAESQHRADALVTLDD